MVELTLDRIGVEAISTDGNVRWALKDISLTCRTGEQIGIIGRNGSGKTTLARLIGGLDRPTKGKLRIQPKHTRIMLVLQRPEDHFIRETVGQQIAGYASQRVDTASIHRLLAKIGLPPDIEKQPPRCLSGGQQRLVAVACALAAKASFIILDEPMVGLDSYSRQMVTQALAELNNDQRLGLIIISHHPDDLLGLVERLWILDEGKLLYDGPFNCSPVTMLSKCLSLNDTSLYYILRQIESRGIKLPESIYRNLKPEEFLKLLPGAQIF